MQYLIITKHRSYIVYADDIDDALDKADDTFRSIIAIIKVKKLQQIINEISKFKDISTQKEN